MNAVRKDTSGFDDVRRALAEGRSLRVKVGVLGNKAERQDEDWNKEKINNPTLGAIHEFGSKTRNIPARSWLRMPLTLFLPKRVDQIGRHVWRALILRRGLKEALKDLGVLAESVIQEAFATGGFGQWAPLSARYARWKMAFTRRKSGKIGPVRIAILILSGQLRKSVTSRVVDRRAAA